MTLRSRSALTPIGALRRGLMAGVLGTALMTGWQSLSARLQSSDDQSGEAADAPPADPWEAASAPAKLAKRVGEGVFHQEVPASMIPLLTNAMHWGYGTGWGTAYGIVAASTRRSRLRDGVLVGSVVWIMSYVQLVPMGLYEPPWKYPPKELAMDLSYHLVYGAGVAGAYALLDRRAAA